MAIVVVGGSTKDIGKTALVCAVISGLSEFGWTAVKITGHSYQPEAALQRQSTEHTGPIICEETVAGQETDTARYLAAGARRALLVTRCGEEMPIDEIRGALKEDRNIIFESNRIIDVVKPDVCLALVGGQGTERKPSFLRLLRDANAVVSSETVELELAELPPGIPRFELQSLDHLTPELAHWLRLQLDRLGCAAGPHRNA